MIGWLVFLGTLFPLVFAGVWIAVALGATALIIFQFLGGGQAMWAGSSAFSGIQIYAFAAMPLYLFVGQILMHSGITKKAYAGLTPITTQLGGSLLHVNILLCAMFAACFGSSSANAAAVGSVAIPELKARHYDERAVLGSVAAGGTLGILIPPSIFLILYGSIIGLSVGTLFMAGFVPGALLALMFLIALSIWTKKTPTLAPTIEKPPSWKFTLRSLLALWPVLTLVAIVLVPIYLGWATAVESGGIGAIGAVILGRTCGELNVKGILESAKATARISSMVLFIVVGALILTQAISVIGLPRLLVLIIQESGLSNMAIILLVCLMYILLGCVIDSTGMLLMTLPFMYPVMMAIGCDPIWFGIFLVVVIEIGMLTPPIGTNLYIVMGVAGKGTKIGTVIRGTLPFLICQLILLLLIVFFPEIALILPRVAGML